MRILTMFLVFLLSTLVSMPVIAAPDEAAKHFAKGQMLISNNCGECVDASRKGLENGIAELKLADGKGYADKAAIYKLMYQAYGDVAFVYAKPDSEDTKKYMNLRQQIAEKLVELLPNDSGILYEYASELKDKNKQLELMQKVLCLDPKNFSARLMIGLRLIETGQLDQGMAQLKQAVKDADPEAKGPYMQQALETLEQNGHKAEADKWRREATSKREQKH